MTMVCIPKLGGRPRSVRCDESRLAVALQRVTAVTVSLAMSLAISLVLSACGSSGGSSAPQDPVAGDDPNAPPPTQQSAACNDPADAAMPPTPDDGEFRDGLSCTIFIDSPLEGGERIAFQVLEPNTLTGGETYPLILEGHGFSGSKRTSDADSQTGSRISHLLANGYGMISIDQRGHGQSGGQITVMDPDREGKNMVAILDWAEANLDWLAYGPDDDAGEDNLRLGAVGQSYGGGYQMILNAADPKKRMDAMVPRITWNDLTYSLTPGGVIKSGWIAVLFGAGNTGGDGANFDPFVIETLQTGLQNNQIAEEGLDYFRYHSQGYFCDGETVATNGGPGTAPELAPTPPGDIDVMFFQGMRDTLFTFTDAYRNFECFKANSSGDVRLLSYQSGHNTLQAVPDPGQAFQPADNALTSSCGTVHADDATLAFFDEHVKGIAGAADAVIPSQICLSLSGTDAVLVDDVLIGGTSADIDMTVSVGTPAQIVTAVATAGDGGDILAGIPTLDITLTDPANTGTAPENTIIFAGIVHQRASAPGVWDLVDNQLLPIRGLGDHSVELVGIAERLSAGDQVGLALYGFHDQFHLGGSRVLEPFAPVVQVTGSVQVPLLGAGN